MPIAFVPGLSDHWGRQGFDAHVGERGAKLSGGQRQRVAIARVLLKDAPILVLDEATSALDSEVEAAIQESFSRLMAGKTVIAIAHRLSTIAAMDRLVVLDHGQIVEMGSHAELIRKGGLYASLWSRQSGGFLDAAPPESVEPRHAGGGIAPGHSVRARGVRFTRPRMSGISLSQRASVGASVKRRPVVDQLKIMTQRSFWSFQVIHALLGGALTVGGAIGALTIGDGLQRSIAGVDGRIAEIDERLASIASTLVQFRVVQSNGMILGALASGDGRPGGVSRAVRPAHVRAAAHAGACR